MTAIFNGNGRPLRVGVIGLGYWGPNLVRNLSELDGVEVAAACDTREEARLRISRRYPAIPVVEDAADVLGDPSIDAVAIATPVGTHGDLAAEALRNGKHVFVEKPLAPSLAEAEGLYELAQRCERVLMVGHTFLYSPPVNMVRDLLRTDQIGSVYFISMSRVNLGIHQPDVSVVWDLGPHDFSILRYWLDETPDHVSAISRACIVKGQPDVTFVHLEYPSGIVAQVELSWLAPSKLRRTTIVGSRRMVVYDDTSMEPIRIFDSGVQLPDPTTFGTFQLSYRTGSIVSPHLEPAEPLSLEMQDFCASVRTGAEPRCTAKLALEVVRIIDAVDRSLALGGERVAVEVPSVAVVA